MGNKKLKKLKGCCKMKCLLRDVPVSTKRGECDRMSSVRPSVRL